MTSPTPPHKLRRDGIRKHRRVGGWFGIALLLLALVAVASFVAPVVMYRGDSRWLDHGYLFVALAHANRDLCFRIGGVAAGLATVAWALRKVLVARWRRRKEW